MSTKTLVDVDLDWLNDTTKPTQKLRRILRSIPRNVPAIITGDHHQVLPYLRRWVKSGKITPPFDVVHIDEHHDFYDSLDPDEVDCANWCFHIPLKWYKRFTWIQNNESLDYEWEKAVEWLNKRDKTVRIMSGNRSFPWKRNSVVAAVFCISPDFMNPNLLRRANEITNIVAKHFNLSITKTIRSGIAREAKRASVELCSVT